MRNLIACLAIGVALALAGGCGLDPDVGEAEQELQPYLPAITSTTINAPIANGRYQLIRGKAYTATVTVDSGTITYLTRLERNPYAMSSTIALSPTNRDDTVIAYRGHTVYTYTITPSSIGNHQVAFQLKDRGSNNVFNQDAGVPVTVSSTLVGPRIASMTFNAPILNGRYQLTANVPYTLRVTVASSNVTYDARLEPSALSPTMYLSPAYRDFSISQYAADRVFTFTITPTAYGAFQVPFRLRDRGTWNVFNSDAVGVNVNPPYGPRVISTTITGESPSSAGEYVLSVGKRYDVVVRVLGGTVGYCGATVEATNLDALPVSANLHNKRASGYPPIAPGEVMDFHFGLTPTQPDSAPYTLGFQMRDKPPKGANDPEEGCYGTGNAFNPDPGVKIVAGLSLSAPGTGGIHGTVRNLQGAAVAGALVTLDNGATYTTSSTGTYWFGSVPTGSHTVSVSHSSYSPTIAVNVPAAASSIQIDLEMEQSFPELLNGGMSYTRYYDYSHGRTLFHVARPNRSRTRVEIAESHDPGGYETATEIAARTGALVAINGGYFDTPFYPEGSYFPVGYFYVHHPIASGEYYEQGSTAKMPVFGITGTGANQRFRIVDKAAQFLDPSPDWNLIGGIAPYWDDDRDGESDVDFALQSFPTLVANGAVTWADPGPLSMEDGQVEAYWARTAIGLTNDGELVMVVADGQGFAGCQGANFYTLASFMANNLQLTTAMGLDGGGSTQMSVYSSSPLAPKLVTTPTAEYALFQGDGAPHPVHNFVMAWRQN